MSAYLYEIRPHPVSYGEVEVARLELDATYQRPVDQARVEKMMEAENPASTIETLTISRRRPKGRKEHLFIVDGGHRHALCLLLGITTVHAEIHDGLSLREEAQLHSFKNKERKPQSKLDLYKSHVAGGIEPAASVAKILEAHDLTVGTTNSTNVLRSVSTLESIVKRYGAHTLDRTLTVVEEAWGRADTTWNGNMLGGIGRFIGVHGEHISDEELSTRLGLKDPVVWAREVVARATLRGKTRSGSGGVETAAYAIVKEAWNKGRKTNRIK